MSTYVAIWQCCKCGAQVGPIRQENAGFWYGYGSGKLAKGPCPAGGDHDWHELTGHWE